MMDAEMFMYSMKEILKTTVESIESLTEAYRKNPHCQVSEGLDSSKSLDLVMKEIRVKLRGAFLFFDSQETINIVKEAEEIKRKSEEK